VAGAQPAVLGDRLACRLRLLVVALEDPLRTHQHLAGIVDPQLDPDERAPDRIGIDLAVGLRRAYAGQFGRAVDLLQIDPDRPEEADRISAERRAAGINETRAAQAHLVAQRAVDHDLADPAPQPQQERQRAIVGAALLDPI